MNYNEVEKLPLHFTAEYDKLFWSCHSYRWDSAGKSTAAGTPPGHAFSDGRGFRGLRPSRRGPSRPCICGCAPLSRTAALRSSLRSARKFKCFAGPQKLDVSNYENAMFTMFHSCDRTNQIRGVITPPVYMRNISEF